MIQRTMMPQAIEDKRIEQQRETFEFFHSLYEELGDKIATFFSEEQENDFSMQSVMELIQILEMMKRLANRDPLTQFSLARINELVSRWLPRLKNAKRIHEEFEKDVISPTSNLAIIFSYVKELLYSAVISATTHIVTIDSQIQATRLLQPTYSPYTRQSKGLRGLLQRIWTGGEDPESSY